MNQREAAIRQHFRGRHSARALPRRSLTGELFDGGPTHTPAGVTIGKQHRLKFVLALHDQWLTGRRRVCSPGEHGDMLPAYLASTNAVREVA